MERRQAEAFVAVIDSGSFSAAAEKLFVTQSAVSQAVAALEADLGAVLIVRGESPSRPSAAGQAVLPLARDILRLSHEARHAVDQVQGLCRGELRIGAVDTAATELLPGPLRRLRRRHPDLDISVSVAGSKHLAVELAEGSIDLALVFGQIPKRFSGLRLGDDPLLPVASPDHPLASKKRLGKGSLRHEKWISYPRGSVTRALIESCFERLDLPFSVLMEIDRPEVILEMVSANLGLGLLPGRLIRRRHLAGRIRGLAFPRLEVQRPIHLIHKGIEHIPPSARALVSLFG